jgi:L-threonylcarbamoyladenylate synthase
MLEIISLDRAVQYLKQGAIVAYPTEAVYGFGCDPNNHEALAEILELKQRSGKKGMILIAADSTQLEYYIDFSGIPIERYKDIMQTWPGFTTWIMPINKSNLQHIDPIIYGQYDTIAVRVTNHPVVKKLCELFGGPIISTSANISGETEVKDIKQLLELIQKSKKLYSSIKAIVAGDLGGYDKPSTIKDGLTSDLIR